MLVVLLQHTPKENWPSELNGKQYVQILGETLYFQLTKYTFYQITAFLQGHNHTRYHKGT